MSLLSKQVEELRYLAEVGTDNDYQEEKVLRDAADTIETLSAKVRAQNLGGDMIYIEDLGAVYDEIEKEWKEKFEELRAGDYMISPGYILDVMEDVRKRTWKIPSAMRGETE